MVNPINNGSLQDSSYVVGAQASSVNPVVTDVALLALSTNTQALVSDHSSISSSSSQHTFELDADGLNALHRAAREGDAKAVEHSLATNSNLLESTTKTHENTPLLLAAYAGKKEVCEMLLKARANYSAKNKGGNNALHLAVKSKNQDVVQLFAARVQLVNDKNRGGATPLQFALADCYGWENEIVRILLHSGADITNERVLDALHKRFDILRPPEWWKRLTFGLDPIRQDYPYNTRFTLLLLLADAFTALEDAVENKQMTNKKELTTLLLAARQAYPQLLGYLRADQKNTHFLDFTTRDGPPFFLLTAEGIHLDLCKLLIEFEANPVSQDYPDNTRFTLLLLLAAAQGNLHIFKALVKADANTEATTSAVFNSLLLAERRGHLNLVSYLLEDKKDTHLLESKTRDGKTPLLLAAEEGHVELCEFLIKLGANPHPNPSVGHREVETKMAAENLRNYLYTSWSVLHAAASRGHTKIIKLFSDRAQLLHATTKQDETPLMLAASHNQLEACTMLVSLKADLKAKDNKSWNALHHAAHGNHTTIVDFLLAEERQLKERQLLEATDKEGATPLLVAASKGHLEVCELLCKLGANFHATDLSGRNVLHWAAELDQKKLVEFFVPQQALFNALANPAAIHSLDDSAPPRNLIELLSSSGNASLKTVFEKQQSILDGRTTQHGFTPLLRAAYLGHLEVCQLLLEVGAKPNLTTTNGWNARRCATRNGNSLLEKLFN